ncbi:MAG: hypothetical protein M3413_02390 [Bacteroidota bacterium]|nr:hypothetical protein [Bacteroidota bacterium]
MWQSLRPHQKVNAGDKIRYVGSNSVLIKEKLFKVTKTEQHYFEIVPHTLEEATTTVFDTNIISYFYLGYTIRFERWQD